MLLYLQMLETPEEKSLFEQIYLEYRGLMYHVAYEILHNDQDAEDAVHQAFVKIVENIKKIDDPVCPKTHGYVVTIVEHQAIDQYRKRQKYQTVELIEEIQGTNAHYEGDNDLTKCILQLPARYREMICYAIIMGTLSGKLQRCWNCRCRPQLNWTNGLKPN